MSWQQIKRVCLFCVALAFVCGGALAAEKESFSFKRLLMPGEVIKGHAEYEQECSKCHEGFREMTQRRLCLDCHEEVFSDVEQLEGFHGRMYEAKTRECKDCHSEHIGRQGDILNLDKDSFDHSQTDFELKGRHAGVFCTSCHRPDKKYRETPNQCYACHETADKHRGALGKECQDCHSNKNWSDTRFDHDDTEFPLLGEHQDAKCNACHPDEKYSKTPTACVSCHALNDVHTGLNGDECSDCHQESSWEKISFDHDKDTDFRLTGSHESLACSACHRHSRSDEKLGTDCIDCHKNNDEHNARYGHQCDSCHLTTRWAKVAFDHDRDTDFTLLGNHSKLSCESCHREIIEDEQLGTSCIDCHRLDDVHQEQQGQQCDNCHNPESWRDQIRFSHNLTQFPLVGMHAVTSCESCHSSKVFRDTKSSCVACHRKDDTHKSALGPACGSCHNPNDWQLWLFDHDAQTDFQLDGAHKGLSCNECHVKSVKDNSANAKLKQSSACVACHLNDDPHNRQFGRACERCHVTESFKEIRVQ